MASDLGWSVSDFRHIAREVTLPRRVFPNAIEGSIKPLAKADWKVGLVVLSKALLDSSGEPRETARPASPNVIRSWAKSWDEVPECYLKHEYLQTLGSFAKGLGEAFAKAFAEAFRKALAKPSPHPSPIQNQDAGTETGTEAGAGEGESPPSAATARARTKTPPPEALAVAARLMTHVVENNPGSVIAKAATAKQDKAVELWANDIRLMHTADGHSYDEIAKVIDWAHRDNPDPFWRGNICSGSKLREKWDTLTAQMSRPLRVVRGGGGEVLDHLDRVISGEVP